MGFASYDQIIEAITVNGQGFVFDWGKGPFSPQGAGYWYSLWGAAGVPGGGANPAAAPGGTTYVQAAGSIWFPDRSPQSTYLLTFGGVGSSGGTLMLYDRLVAVGGVALSPAGAKTLTSSALPRYADGAGVQAWVEVTTATAGGGTIALSSYTNQDGVSGRAGAAVGYPFSASNATTFVGPLPLQSGDTGIRSIEQVTTATSTAGVVNVVLLRPLVFLPVAANGWQEKDMVIQIASMPQLYDGASLAIALQAGGTAQQQQWGQIGIAWG